MSKGGIPYLLGMLSMLILLLIGDYLFDESSRDFNRLKEAFYAGQEMHTNALENRLRIEAIIQSENISDQRKVGMLQELWAIDNTTMVSQMLMYIRTNERLSPVYQVNMSESQRSLEEWLIIMDNDETSAVATQNKLK